MNTRIILLAGALIVTLIAAACSSTADESMPTTTNAAVATTTTAATPAGGAVAVSIEDFAFGPAGLTINVGDTVTWTNNEEGVPHTTTSDDGVWDSKNLSPGDTFSFTFDQPGTYTYHCSIHPSMTAAITVNG